MFNVSDFYNYEVLFRNTISDKDIQFLKDLVPSGELHWFLDEKTCRKIVAIYTNRKYESEEDSEPGPVAYFDDGKYIALLNCEPYEFVIIKPVFGE